MVRRRDGRTEAIAHVTQHARARMREYFGRDLTRDEWLSVVDAIRTRQAVCMARSRDGYTYWLMPTGEYGRIRFVWRDDSTGAIVTVLSQQARNHRIIEQFVDKRLSARPQVLNGGYVRGEYRPPITRFAERERRAKQNLWAALRRGGDDE
jgi:hypothetical protein